MLNNKTTKLPLEYLLGTILQMAVACAITLLFAINKIDVPPIVSVALLVLGGTSSMIWGAIIAQKSGFVTSFKQILISFFNIKQSAKFYALIVVFLIITFGYPIITVGFVSDIKWYSFFINFAIAIAFGGIEEIGWRYTFQPLLQKKICFEAASVITFICWGLWHYMYFYLSGSILNIEHIPFLIGLLGNCFTLGAIYQLSNSLWLCVMYHCLINTFSQTVNPGSLSISIVSNLLCIFLTVFITRNTKAIEFFKAKPNTAYNKITQ